MKNHKALNLLFGFYRDWKMPSEDFPVSSNTFHY